MRRPLAPLLVAALSALAAAASVARGQATTPSDGQAATSTQARARVSGVVFDSIAGVPLPAAIVQLIPRNDPTRSHVLRSDERGTFASDSIPAGSYYVGFLHPRLDSLLLRSPVQRIEVPGSGGVQLKLFVPSRRALTAALCGGDAAKDSTGVFVGHVRSAQSGRPVVRAVLRLQWAEMVIENGMRRRLPTLAAETNRDGAFAICGLPADTRILVQAWTDQDTSGVIEVDMPAAGLLLRDLRVGSFDRVLVPGRGAALSTDAVKIGVDSVTVLRGNGRLRGTVRTSNQRPVAGARVRVRETGIETTTNAAGVFTLQSLPTGSHAVESSAIGFQPARVAADISESGEESVDLVLDPLGSRLDTVQVFGSRMAPVWRKEFDARRKLGVGRYIDEAALAKQDPMTVADVLDQVPSITIRPGKFSARTLVLFRQGSSEVGYCLPNVFIDGTYRESPDGNVDELVSAREIRAIEIYRSALLAPVAFQPRTPCGVLVIWTGHRPPEKKK